MLNGRETIATARHEMENAGVSAAPFVDAEGRYLGAVSLADLRAVTEQADPPDIAGLLDADFASVPSDRHLDVVLDVLTSTPQTWTAVVDDQRRVLGTITTSDIVRSYTRALQTSLRRATEIATATGMIDVTVEEDAPIVGATLRAAQIPPGLLITTIERGRDVIPPTGDTTIRAGDRIMALGSPNDLDQLQRAVHGNAVL